MTAINAFRGDYAFLSNFHSSPITISGITFPTVEHAFQAAKVRLDHSRRHDAQVLIAEHPTPAGAKQAGRTLKLRTDWKTAHLPIMRRLLKLKFAPGSALCRALMDTADRPLIESNYWNDTYWGVCNGSGRNQLGVLLMELRAELQSADMAMDPDERRGSTPATRAAVARRDAQPSRDQLIDRNLAAGLELGQIPA